MGGRRQMETITRKTAVNAILEPLVRDTMTRKTIVKAHLDRTRPGWTGRVPVYTRDTKHGPGPIKMVWFWGVLAQASAGTAVRNGVHRQR